VLAATAHDQQDQEAVEGNAASAGGGETGAQVGYDNCEYWVYDVQCTSSYFNSVIFRGSFFFNIEKLETY
jgi:hypothetical protein